MKAAYVLVKFVIRNGEAGHFNILANCFHIRFRDDTLAKAFAHEGAKLVLVSTQEEELYTLKMELGFREKRVMTRVADARDQIAMQELADAVIQNMERVDILLHLGGGYRGGSLEETSNEVWEHMLNLNLRRCTLPTE